MKFTQSRFQDYFSRCYEALCYFGWYLIMSIMIKMLLSKDIGLFKDMLLFAVITIGTLVYLKFKHKGGSQYLEFADDKIIYKFHNLVTEIKPDDYQGYEITKFLPYQVTIRNKVYGKTTFSYYAFSSSQRKQIFELLDAYPEIKSFKQNN